MLWKDRLLSALIAVMVSAALTAAVVRLSPEKPRFTPGQIAAGITFEATGVPSDEMIATVEGNSAPAELLAYEIGYSCAQLERMLQTNFGRELDLDETLANGMVARDYIREESLQMLKQQLVLENLAARNGVTLPEEAERAVTANREAYRERYGEEGYRAELYKTGLSEESYDRVMRAGYLYNALYDAYITPGSTLYADDDVLHAYAAGAGWISADHILLMTVDQATGAPLDSETVEQKRQLAEELLWRLRDSSDPIALFDELADEYGEDPGRAAYPSGYTFTRGEMVDEFDAAARALAEGEYSDVVESQFGYHIILRRPLNVAAAVSAVRDEYFEVFFLAELDRAEMEVSSAASRFDPAAIYAALKAAQTPEDEG